ncbi:MAG: aspartate carbamoyltransferase [Oscillospiraceae bacterium]|nr:aspartate carbamoyltransferase [Oscillospiraceae bacterium]
MQSRHLIDLSDLCVNEWENITRLACDIRANIDSYYGACRGKILATLFYEPSTRTQMSFQTAMLRLGGRIIGFDNPSNSSVAKGESLKDTVRVVSGYSDIIAMRHPVSGSAMAASLYSRVPIINAGDGGHLHPTQTLTDLVTLRNEKGSFSGLCIGLCGDLKNGRTVHSLIKAMSGFPDNRFVLISTPSLAVPLYIKDYLSAAGTPWHEVSNLADAMPLLDVLYMTRIQKERFASEAEYINQRGVFVLDSDKMAMAKKDLIVLHPLPRVDEITVEVDDDKRAKYFEQTEYGLYARMALIMKMLEDSSKQLPTPPPGVQTQCSNPNCITRIEPYVPHIFRKSGDILVCSYCEERTLLD